MSRRRPRFSLPPRGLTAEETGWYLGLGTTQFRKLLPRLEADGFPKPDPLTGRRDLKAIEVWWDRRSGLAADDRDGGLMQRLDALRHGT